MDSVDLWLKMVESDERTMRETEADLESQPPVPFASRSPATAPVPQPFASGSAATAQERVSSASSSPREDPADQEGSKFRLSTATALVPQSKPATQEDCLPSFASKQTRKQTKPEKNMMPATNDDFAGKEVAQNKDARTTSRHRGTRKPRSASPKKEEKRPPSYSKKSNKEAAQNKDARTTSRHRGTRKPRSASPKMEEKHPSSSSKTTIVEPARPGAVRIAGTNAPLNDDNRADSWSVFPPSDDLEKLELGIEHDSPDCTIEAELAPDLQDIKAQIRGEMQQENADRLEREREMEVEIAEATEVIPYTEDQTYDRKVCGLSQTKSLLVLGMVFLVVVVGAVTGLVLATGNGDERTTSPSTSPSTSAPSSSISPSTSPSTSAPTSAPTMKIDYLRNWLGPLVTANATLFQDPSTPQYEALNWLAYRDGFIMPEQDTDAESYRYIQRYVAAHFFASSNMRDWVGDISGFENSSVCEWNNRLQPFTCSDVPILISINFGMCDCYPRFFDF
jgi:hypothetical protein